MLSQCLTRRRRPPTMAEIPVPGHQNYEAIIADMGAPSHGRRFSAIPIWNHWPLSRIRGVRPSGKLDAVLEWLDGRAKAFHYRNGSSIFRRSRAYIGRVGAAGQRKKITRMKWARPGQSRLGNQAGPATSSIFALSGHAIIPDRFVRELNLIHEY